MAAFWGKVLKPFAISFREGEILPPEVLGYMMRSGVFFQLVEEGKIEVGRNG